MKKNLLEILDERKIFKLVLGLGNQSEESIISNVKIYASAGCDMFDINASEKAIQAVYKGIEQAGKKKEDFLLCLSIGVSGDAHINKAEIIKEKCTKCSACVNVCPQDAIVLLDDGYPFVQKEKCIGCKRCKCKAISFFEKESDFDEALKLAEKYNIDCIEVHLASKKPPYDKLKYLIKRAKTPLSFCLDRKYYSNEKIRKIVEKIKKWIGGSDFIIQADGVPMSGGKNNFNSTLQAVAMAHIVEKFGTYVILSGGTNEKTAQLAKMCDVKYNGIGVGSYAREIIKGKDADEAIACANNLVTKCKE